MAQQDLARLSANLTSSGQDVKIANVTRATGDSDATNVAWVKDYLHTHGNDTDSLSYFKVNSTLGPAKAIGGDAIAVGPNTRAEGGSSVSMAHGGGAYGDNSIFIGSQDTDGGGVDPSAHRGVAIGYGALVAGNATDGIAIGSSTDANSGHHYSIAFGYGAQTTLSNQLVIGSPDADNSISNIQTPHFRPSSQDQYITVDTDGHWKLADAGGQGEISWVNERDSETFTGITTVEVDDDTGLEVVMGDSGEVRIRKYTAPSNFAISIGSGQGNRSWFNSATTDTATVGASTGTLTTINTATVNNSSTDVTINQGSQQVTYPVSATPGSYTLRVTATGNNSDGSVTGQSASASHGWSVYRDWWLATNQSGADAAFSATAGRQSSNWSNRTISAHGWTFLTVDSESVGDLSFRTNLGNLTPLGVTTVTVTLNSVTKTYRRYSIGNFPNETDVIVSGG